MAMALQAGPGRSGEFITLPPSKTASDYDLCEEPMSLADVCHDRVLAIVKAREARDRDLVIKGVQELIEDLNRYAGYYEVCPPGGEIDALRRAAQRVIDHPDDEDDLLWLLALAEGVRRLYDCSVGIDHWCALYLRGREDHFAGRCGECGAEDGVKRFRDRFGEMLNVVMTRKG